MFVTGVEIKYVASSEVPLISNSYFLQSNLAISIMLSTVINLRVATHGQLASSNEKGNNDPIYAD